MSPDKNLLATIQNWNKGKKDFESTKKYLMTLKSAYRGRKSE